MPLYKCEYCNYSTKIKGQLHRHEKSNKHHNKLIELGIISEETHHMNQNEPQMNQNEPSMNQNEPPQGTKMNQNEPAMNQKSFICEFCESRFKTQASCRRHEIHRCKENPDITYKLIDDKNLKIKTLEKDKEILEKDKEIHHKEKEQWEQEKEKWEQEKEKLYEQVSNLLDKVGDTNIQQNNIILNNFGSEDLSHITDALKTELLKIPYGAIPKMIEAVHFNKEKPENKNIMLPNKKENLVKVFQDNKWVFRNKNEAITDLVDSKYNILDEHYDKLENTPQITTQVQTSYTKFRKFYDDGDAEMLDNIKKDCELVLLNNR